jgi:hypothetical protein
MGAQILAVELTSIFTLFGISMNFYSFADSETIWKLSYAKRKSPLLDFLYIIDALRIGTRPDSYLLDAFLKF